MDGVQTCTIYSAITFSVTPVSQDRIILFWLEQLSKRKKLNSENCSRNTYYSVAPAEKKNAHPAVDTITSDKTSLTSANPSSFPASVYDLVAQRGSCLFPLSDLWDFQDETPRNHLEEERQRRACLEEEE